MERTRDTTWERKRLMAVKLPTVWPEGANGRTRRQGAERKAHRRFFKNGRRGNTKKVANAENSHG